MLRRSSGSIDDARRQAAVGMKQSAEQRQIDEDTVTEDETP